MPNPDPNHDPMYPLSLDETPADIMWWRDAVYAACTEAGIDIYMLIHHDAEPGFYTYSWGPSARLGELDDATFSHIHATFHKALVLCDARRPTTMRPSFYLMMLLSGLSPEEGCDHG